MDTFASELTFKALCQVIAVVCELCAKSQCTKMYYLLCLFKASSTHAYTHLVLQNRVWQRDSRDIPVIQPDATYFNEVRQNQIFLPLHLSLMSSQTFPLCSVTVGKM